MGKLLARQLKYLMANKLLAAEQVQLPIECGCLRPNKKELSACRGPIEAAPSHLHTVSLTAMSYVHMNF